MPQQNYLDELTPAFTSLLAIKEASRCLLCHDAPCSQACPAQTDPGKCNDPLKSCSGHNEWRSQT